MKINHSDLQSKLNVYQAAQLRGGKNKAAGAQKAAAAPQQDHVALSRRGQLIADAQRAIASIPDVREPLVSKIQNNLQQGTYAVDSQKAAEGILRESMVNQAAMA